jgi:hypothetical protein
VFVWTYGGGWIEMKRAKEAKTLTRGARSAGQLTAQQKSFKLWCEQRSVNHAVAYSADEALAVLVGWGVLDIGVARI